MSTQLVTYTGHQPGKVGAKARSLMNLDAAGHRVPPAIVLDSEQALLIAANQQDALRRLIYNHDHFWGGTSHFAVRSSGLISMPGILETRLDVAYSSAGIHHAIIDVVMSWYSERAQAYRARYGISQDFAMGIVVQHYIAPGSGTLAGVMLTRNPDTGEAHPEIEYVTGAGEGLVGGRRAATALTTGVVYEELLALAPVLEREFKEPLEVEWVYDGRLLWLVQARPLPHLNEIARSRVAHDLYEAKVLTATQANDYIGVRLSTSKWHLRVNTQAAPLAQGIGSVPGAVTGKLSIGRDFGPGRIFVATHTEVEDAEAMLSCDGILTAVGSRTCHASMLARAAGIPAVVNAGFSCECQDSIQVPEDAQHWINLFHGDTVTIDGATGALYQGPQPITNVLDNEETESPTV